MANTICRHERSHIVDSRFHGHGYSHPEVRAMFCDRCRLQRWLDVEVALAIAQGQLGIIPAWAAGHIRAAARVDRLDLDAIATGIRTTGHSLVALLDAFQRACSPEAAEFVHYGATTQDIQDTAQSIEIRGVLDVLDDELGALLARLRELALEHRDSLMIARTHAMPALPTTFGLKVAGWIDELLRHDERLRELRSRVLVAQLFGGVGTMAAFGPEALELVRRFAAQLQLGVPLLGWHAARDRVAEFVSALAALAASAARIADEVRTLSRPELAEVAIAWRDDQVGSSTMPFKRNPERCEQVVVLARLARMQVSAALDAMVQEHERDYRGTRLEWCAVADVSHYATAALRLTREVVTDLEIDTDAMARSAAAARDSITTERLMFALGAVVGKNSAYRLVAELAKLSRRSGRALAATASVHPEVVAALGTTDALDRVFDLRAHLGAHRQLIDRVLARADRAAERPDAPITTYTGDGTS